MKKRRNGSIWPAAIAVLMLAICGIVIYIVNNRIEDTVSQVSESVTSSATTTTDISDTVSQESSDNSEKSTSLTTSENSSSNANSSDISSRPATSQPDKIDTSSCDINQWYLKLANYNNPLPSDYEPELKTIKNTNLKFHAKAVSALEEMIAAAKKDGVDLSVASAYRSYSRQTTLYNNEVNSYVQQGYELEEARQVAAMSVAVPGTSEHHLGLAVDFYPVSEKFESSAQYNWLKKNAEKYGFILRYPTEKQSITRIKYEPWHYRFVGKEHAEFMNEHNMCLEEYIEYLKDRQ